MAGKYRNNLIGDGLARVELRLPVALKDHLADSALEHRRSLNEEVVDRLLHPYTQDEQNTETYEGYHSLDVLALRTEPQDVGGRIELWRALRDVSRKWLAHELGTTPGRIMRWETGHPMSIPEDILIEQLAQIDKRRPHFARMAAERLIMVRKRNEPTPLRELENVEIDWLPGSVGELWNTAT